MSLPTPLGKEPEDMFQWALSVVNALNDKFRSPTPRVIPGTVALFAGATAPTGWYQCSGQAASRKKDASLFKAIGTTYGAGDGSTTFGLPPTGSPPTHMMYIIKQ